MIIVKGSTRGCGARYVLRGQTPQGEFVRVETNPCSESNEACDIHNQNARIFRVEIREVGLATPIADSWATSESSGTNLEFDFEAQKAIATNKEQSHGQ